jgi:hypothetical protein
MKTKSICSAAFGLAAVLAASSAQAAFHLWNIREIYSDSSGSLQFMELFTAASGQTLLNNQSFTVTPSGGGPIHTFTLTNNLSADSANRTVLVGTAGLHAAGAPTPDFIMPNNFLFQGGGTIAFFGTFGNSPVVYSALPTDGIHSRVTLGGNGDQVNSPENFAGQMGMVVPEPAVLSFLLAGGIGLGLLLNRPRKR